MSTKYAPIWTALQWKIPFQLFGVVKFMKLVIMAYAFQNNRFENIGAAKQMFSPTPIICLHIFRRPKYYCNVLSNEGGSLYFQLHKIKSSWLYWLCIMIYPRNNVMESDKVSALVYKQSQTPLLNTIISLLEHSLKSFNLLPKVRDWDEWVNVTCFGNYVWSFAGHCTIIILYRFHCQWACKFKGSFRIQRHIHWCTISKLLTKLNLYT